MGEGLFITFEGGEGSGKTSVINRLAEEVRNLGKEVLVTREPGGVKVAESIRGVILDKENKMDAMTELLLYVAARNEHLEEVIKPALAKGKVVLCDRYVDSSLAYQGYARGLGLELVKELNDLVVGGVIPKRTYFLDVEPMVGLSRIGKDLAREINRLDIEDITFHEKVREGYLQVMGKYGGLRMKRIDANNIPEIVFEEIKHDLIEILKSPSKPLKSSLRGV